VLQRCPDGCSLDQFEAFGHRGRSGRKVLVVRTVDALIVERSDKISCRSNECKGSNLSDLEFVQNILET